MKTFCCILLPAMTEYLEEPLEGYGSYGSALRSYIDSLGSIDQVYLYTLNPHSSSEHYFRPFLSGHNLISLKTNSKDALLWSTCLESLVEEIGQEVLQQATLEDSLGFFFADHPFLNSHISQEVRALFHTYKADFSFADGYPLGLSQELLSLQRLQGTLSLSVQHPVQINRGGLFELIQKDINSYHIETRISGEDHRLTRLELNGSSKRSHLLVQRLSHQVYTHQSPDPWDDLTFEQVFRETNNSHRTIPSAVHLELVAQCPYSCSYCPYPLINKNHLKDQSYVSLENIQLILSKLVPFMPEGTLSLSTFGEPGLHPQISSILRYLDEKTPYSIVVETTGTGWKPSLLDEWKQKPFKKTRFIIGLDTVNPQVYLQLGKTQFEQTLQWTTSMVESFPDSVFVQALRLKGNEKDLLEFYQYWSQKTSQIVIQKHDSYAGFLPDLKVVDLQPVKRFPCWHLKREIYINRDGDIGMCKEDLKGESRKGNIFQDDPREIWDRLAEYYQHHRENVLPTLCKTCDEYYTYNY